MPFFRAPEDTQTGAALLDVLVHVRDEHRSLGREATIDDVVDELYGVNFASKFHAGDPITRGDYADGG